MSSEPGLRINKYLSERGLCSRREADAFAREEPLEIRVQGQSVAVTMRTPGADFELAAGFLLTEGLIAEQRDIADIRYCEDVEDAAQQYNVLSVRLARPFDAASLQRNMFASSSCGVCGKASIDDVVRRCSIATPVDRIRLDALISLPEELRRRQEIFGKTGALHAAAIAAIGTDGTTTPPPSLASSSLRR